MGSFDFHWYILPTAFLLDLILGDPFFLPHPIRWMGQAISGLEASFRKLSASLVFCGGVFSIFLVVVTYSLTVLILETAHAVHPVLASIVQILLVYYSISIRSLEKSAMAVAKALNRQDLTNARDKVAHIIGRDVQALSSEGVAAGAVESVAENLVDGAISPLFYACIGGAPLAMAYKMVNTLDSMIGYRNERYEKFGKVAARIDDLANYIPARVSVLIISIAAQILSGKGMTTFKTAVSEGANHTSPNAGYPEAAFAGALEVKLNGPNRYGGILVEKPFIGVRFNRPKPFHIKKACDLMILSAFLWFVLAWLINILRIPPA